MQITSINDILFCQNLLISKLHRNAFELLSVALSLSKYIFGYSLLRSICMNELVQKFDVNNLSPEHNSIMHFVFPNCVQCV